MEIYRCSRLKKHLRSFSYLARFLALLLFLREADGQSPCYNEITKAPLRCMPSFGNAAFNKAVQSNNTCGTPPSEFCVQTGVTSPTKQCETCDAKQDQYSHPAVYITDIKNDQNRTWWQSETLETSNKPVSITLDLGKTYDVSYIRIRFRSPRPESMAIYKKTSTDPNAPWIPYQYMSASCEKTYKVKTNDIVRTNQQVLCTNEFSSISPLTGGNVAFTTLQGRPDNLNFDNSPELQDWVTASAIRIDLNRMNTFGDEMFGDTTVLRSYYFAIIDLTVGGRCKCNGHAASCGKKQLPSGDLQLMCICDHNTTGVDCEECHPLYNNRPWARATESSANECIKCDCNDLADSCVYDENLGYGRCENCKRNTAGPKCERCRDNFFRLTPSDDCQACNCDPVGSASLQCDTKGKCTCKPGVTGIKCDKCQANFFGFSQTGCRACQCDLEGTDPSNTQCNEKGECSCKRNVIGAKCNKCRTGYFGLESSNPHGCRQCFCYGHTNVCDKAEGYVGRNISNDFTRGLNGWTVINEQGSDVTDQYAVPHVGEGHISVTAIGNEVLYVSAPAMYLGNLRSSYGQLFGFSFRVAAVEGVQVEPSDIILESEDGNQVSVRLNAQNNPIPNTDFQNYVFRLHEDPSLGWQPMLRGFDFQKLLTNLKAIKIRMNYGPQGTGLLDNVFLESALYDPRSAPELQVPWVENCTCPAPYTGKNCEQCSVGYTRQRGSDNRYGQCIPCQCYGHSDSCDPVTGVCSCQDNTVGDNCEKCKDGFYGNPTVGNKDDCKPCPCVFGSRCIQIAERVVCTDCPEGHTGDLCDYCQDGYHGDLLGSSIGCEKCNCSGNIEMNAIGNCDSLTGECLKCIYNTRNGPLERCELCAVGFYGNATHYPKPQCIACDCYTQGTVKPPDHNPEDPLPCDDKGRCSCKEKVIGDNCDSCQDTYWNVGSGNGCEQCLCDKTGSLNDSCDVITGQCPCKPGVSGRTCDQCQSDHFGFSDQGCQPCSCNPQGSLGESCDEYGVCSCKLGVLGIKCDSCEENKHNLTAGCIRCPACYNEIELLVNRLRINIRELVRIMDQFNSSSSGGIVVDPNFERRLKELKEAINNLLEKAEKSNSTDRALQEQLQVLTERVDKINEIMTDVINNTSVTEELISSALGNISEAEQSINRSRLMLDEAEKLLVDRGEKALNESILAAKSTSEQATRMAEIRNETSLLADKHENEADGVIENANEILNKSKQAVSDTEKVVTAQKKTTDGLEELLRKFNKTIQMHQQAANTADKSRGSSQSALDEANELFENGTAPLPEFGLQEMKGDVRAVAKINNSKAELAITSNSTEEILSDLETLVTTFAMKEEYVRKKMAEWPGLFETLQELLTNVTGANETAHNAIARGEETLKKAKDLLERLKKFNEIIDTSRAEADRAEANTTEIERLISSANNKSDEAAVTLETTENLARKAKTIAGEASETANRTGEKAKEIKEEAELLTIPEDNVTDPVLEATDELNDHKNTAAEEEKSIADALNKTKEAGEAAKNAREKIKEVHDRLMALLKEIEGLGSVNMTIMNRIKNQLQNETDLVRQLDREVSAVEKEREQIKNQIKEYTIDLTRYRAQKKLLQETYEKLPKVCPRTTPRPET